MQQEGKHTGQRPNHEGPRMRVQQSMFRTGFLSKNGQHAFGQRVPCALMSLRNTSMWVAGGKGIRKIIISIK